jgi:hypothetical protein
MYHDFGSSTSNVAISNMFVNSFDILPSFCSLCIELVVSLIFVPLMLFVFLKGLL